MAYNQQLRLDSVFAFLDQKADGNLYAIAQNVEELWFNLDFWGLEHACLLQGEDAEARKQEAPYLVRLDRDNKATQTLLGEFGSNKLLLLGSSETLPSLREKFLALTHVNTEYRERAVFLFFVPRMFRHYVQRADRSRQQELFDGVDFYCCESSTGYELAAYTLHDGELALEHHPVEGYSFDADIVPNIHNPARFAAAQ